MQNQNIGTGIFVIPKECEEYLATSLLTITCNDNSKTLAKVLKVKMVRAGERPYRPREERCFNGSFRGY